MRTLLMMGPLMLAFACNGDDKDPADDTDTDTTDTDTVDDTDETDEPPPTPTCASWCATLASACSEDPTYGFPDEASCNTWCAASGIAAGMDGDTSGNTLGCRTYHAGVADAGDAAAKAMHCPHASSMGGGVCGDILDNYCEIIDHVCTGANEPTWTTDCATDAAAYPAGTPGDTSGDSLSCRLYHLGVAVLMPDTHCAHAGPTGGGVCVDI